MNRSALVVGGVAVMLVAALLVAGPLTPPAGPVASTYKTLQEVEPRIAINAANTPGDADSLFRITQPGSYYLTGNITGLAGRHGIEIAASGVTIDLMGFDLVGVAAMGPFDGVTVSVAGLVNVAVVNGSIRNWGDDGVDFAALPATNSRVDGVLVSGSGGTGILVGLGCTISNCSAHANTASGFLLGDGSTISDCAAYDNSGNGVFTSTGCTVLNCSAFSNSLNGISASNGCTVSTCTTYQNGSSGIVVSSGATVANCTARDNATNGISAINGATITGCTVYASGGSGIVVGVGCVVEGCSATFCTSDGIVCASTCLIRDNTCATNGFNAGNGAGVHATGSDNRIEGNNCTNADLGIDVDGAGNFIARNTCSGNTVLNWSVAAGNVCLVVQGVAGGAIAGNTGGVAPGSTDPNANYTY